MMAPVGYRQNQVRANVITSRTTINSNQMIPTKNKEITIKVQSHLVHRQHTLNIAHFHIFHVFGSNKVELFVKLSDVVIDQL